MKFLIALLFAVMAAAVPPAVAQIPGGGGVVVGTPIIGPCPLGQFVYNNGGVVGCAPAGLPGSLNLANYLTAAQLTTAQAGANTQDLTTPITTWLAACPATGCQYVVPPGYFYSATCNFNITNAFSMVGAGTRGLLGTQFVSVIACGSTSARLFNVSSKIGLFKDFSPLQVGGTATAGSSFAWVCTAGASADCTTSVGADNTPSISFENLMIDGFYDTVDIGVAQSWHLVNSTIQNCVHWCARVRNTVNPDAGDWFISGNQIFPLGSADAAIRWESSGGGHINRNEVVPNTGGGISNCISVDTGVTVSVEIFIQDNKCESVRGPNIAIYTGWREVVITGNVARVDAVGIASFTGAIAAGTNTLTVSGSVTNKIYKGQVVTGAGVPNGTYIKSFGSGTGGTGTYNLNLTSQITIGGVGEAMTSSSPGVLCAFCLELVISGNVVTKLGASTTAGAAAILLDNVTGAGANITSGTVRTNNVNNYLSPLMLVQSYGVSFDGNSGFTLANSPDPTQLSQGSTSFVTDAVTPVAMQPFNGGGKIGVPVVSDGSRWLSTATVLASNYLGPGDIKPGAKVWYGLRAYSAATAGTKAANICNAGDANCVDVNTLANGLLDMVAVAAIPCTGNLDCNVKTLYNKAGANCTTDTTCDITQATINRRPRLAFGNGSQCTNAITGIGVQPCMYQSADNSTRLVSVGTLTVAQPFTVVGAAARQNTFAGYSTIIAGVTAGSGLYFHLANGGDCFIAADKAFASVDAQWQALMCIGNSPTNQGVANGVTTGLSAGAGNFMTAETVSAFNDSNLTSGAFKGVVAEFGIWSSAFSAGDITNMNNNIRAWYAF